MKYRMYVIPFGANKTINILDEQLLWRWILYAIIMSFVKMFKSDWFIGIWTIEATNHAVIIRQVKEDQRLTLFCQMSWRGIHDPMFLEIEIDMKCTWYLERPSVSGNRNAHGIGNNPMFLEIEMRTASETGNISNKHQPQMWFTRVSQNNFGQCKFQRKFEVKTEQFLFKKMNLKVSSAKYQALCLDLNVLTRCMHTNCATNALLIPPPPTPIPIKIRAGTVGRKPKPICFPFSLQQ